MDYELIRQSLTKFVRKASTNIELGKVKSLNENEGTCICELVEDNLEVQVNLGSTQNTDIDCLLVPKVNSLVMLLQEESNWYLLFVSELESVLFHKGENGGLIKIDDLVSRLNAIENAFNNLLNDYKNHNHTHPQGNTVSFVVPSSIQNLQNTQKNDIENPKVKH